MSETCRLRQGEGYGESEDDMSAPGDERLSKQAQEKIFEITESAKRGEISWDRANQMANAERKASGGSSYDYKAGGGSGSSSGSSKGSSSGGSGMYEVPVIDTKPGYTSGGVTYSPSADMSRRQDLAGKYAISGGYTVFYDQDGYATRAVKGRADYAPHLDRYAGGGYTDKLWTDQEILSGDDLSRIQALRNQAMAGQISWDEANRGANAIRDRYGYTIDQGGNVTDLAAKARVDARRAAWGLTDQQPTSEQAALLQTLYPSGSSALNQLYGASGTQSGAGDFGGGAEAYLRDMYAAKTAAELAALESTFQQNVADVDANDDLISNAYTGQKNQTAAQNELQRMQMNEFALAQGLNTGTAGQLALAQSAALQGNLASLGSQEAQSLSENALRRQQLTAAYRGAIDQAKAAGDAALASALYEEYVRQENLDWQRQQAALDQANWERQFQYGREQDALSQQNWEAQMSYQQALDQRKYASAGGNSGPSKEVAAKSGYNNGGLTTDQVKQLQRTLGVTADGLWGSASASAAGGLAADQAWAKYVGQRSQANLERLEKALRRGEVTEAEANEILDRMGV